MLKISDHEYSASIRSHLRCTGMRSIDHHLDRVELADEAAGMTPLLDSHFLVSHPTVHLSKRHES